MLRILLLFAFPRCSSWTVFLPVHRFPLPRFFGLKKKNKKKNLFPFCSPLHLNISPLLLLSLTTSPPFFSPSYSLFILFLAGLHRRLLLPLSPHPPPPPPLCAAGGALPLVLTCRGTDSVKVVTLRSGLRQGLVLHTHTSA